MSHSGPEGHGPGVVLAHGELGRVSLCSCGVVTVTLQYLSLRFEPAAFRELQVLLVQAQRRIDLDAALLSRPAAGSGDAPPAH